MIGIGVRTDPGIAKIAHKRETSHMRAFAALNILLAQPTSLPDITTVDSTPFVASGPKHNSINTDFTFSSRSFLPLIGILEDPVCGSAHTLLATYWRTKLGLAFGDRMLAWQASARGGVLRLSVQDKEVCFVDGQAVTVMAGRLFV